jgi:predicted DCC family thiol-disulfide oxidoreductase YuxK
MSTALTLYYDGNCPFCSAEMRRLKSWNKDQQLGFVDITDAGFDPAHLQVDMAALNREMHSQRADGVVLVGIDSLLAAYCLVRKGWIVLPLRVSFLRPPLAYLYRKFAANRYRMSRWMGYAPVHKQCEGDTCGIGNPFLRK